MKLILLSLLPLFGFATDTNLRRKLAKRDRTKPPKQNDPQDPPNTGDYPTCTKADGTVLRLWTMDEVQRNKTYCNIVFYDRVYIMDQFIPIHKGGSEAIERNCQKDATWLFENLQCISMIPDHFEGMLNMCTGYEVGVIAGSQEDPCKDSVNDQADPGWEKPIYPDPDFTTCDVYHNITCEALSNNPTPLLPLPSSVAGVISYEAAIGRRWKPSEVEAAQNLWTKPDIGNNFTEHCYTILHGWVYDLAVSPCSLLPETWKWTFHVGNPPALWR